MRVVTEDEVTCAALTLATLTGEKSAEWHGPSASTRFLARRAIESARLAEPADERDEELNNLHTIIENQREHMTNSTNALRWVLEEVEPAERQRIIKLVAEKRKAARDS